MNATDVSSSSDGQAAGGTAADPATVKAQAIAKAAPHLARLVTNKRAATKQAAA